MTFDEVVSKYELTQEEIESLRDYVHLEFADSDYFIDLEDSIKFDIEDQVKNFKTGGLPPFTYVAIDAFAIQDYVDSIISDYWLPVLDIGNDTIYVEKV